MIDSITRITLNLQETNTMVSIRAKRGDTGRKLLIHLSDGSIPYHISDDCYATFTAKKPDGTKINNACTIENNVIEYEFTDQTCTAVGTMKAEIRLYGADDKMITSACFLVNVYDTVFRDGDEVDSEGEMNTLDDLILRANAFLNETGKLLRWQGNWDSETEYETNDLVLHEEVLYVAEEAIAAGTAPGSEEVTAWVPIAGMGTGSGGEVVGIASVKQTIKTSTSGGLNVVTVTLTDGTESEIAIRNGHPGASIQGPQGPMGPQGIRGPMGPTGATGPQGPAGPAGGDYVLTPADKEEIAEMAADLVEVPEHSGGNVDLTGYVQSVNGVSPDENGNVEIAVSDEVTLPDNLVYYIADSGDDTGEEESGTVGGSTVAVTQVLTSGVEIAKISVDGEETTLYAPEVSSEGGSSGSGESAGIPGFSLVFNTTTTEEIGAIDTNLDLSPYSEVFGFIRTLPADGSTSGHAVWTFDRSTNYCYITSSLNATQERIHLIHLTRYTGNRWFGNIAYKTTVSNNGEKYVNCMVEATKINSVGSWLGGINLKIGTTVEIYAR